MHDNKVALVTGGMGGLGTAICRRLQAEGFRVAATYSPGNATPDAWLAAQRDEGYRFTAYRVDVTDYGDCEWMMQKLLAEMGRLDVLVICTTVFSRPGPADSVCARTRTAAAGSDCS